ncbi:formimidoylglutamase [Castellaniella caeni]|uniref:formimidoylglutamase n=1 Tax=Castellaniella caeni TaxID=266123 RepID=UPI00082FB4A3|nr:formimidoylglutamase [Castellaniella caeni]
MNKPESAQEDAPVWTGRVDDEPATPRWHQQVQAPTTGAAPGVFLLGFACDAGVLRNHGRIGARKGPAAVRRALAGMAWHGDTPVYDGGDVTCGDDAHGGALEAAQRQFAARVTAALEAGHRPLGMGGGHEIAFASWQGIAAHLAHASRPPRIGIVNFDAHFDLRAPVHGGTSGTSFAQIAADCAQRGWRYRYACLGVSRASNTQALFHRARELDVLVHEDLDFERAPDTVRRNLAAFVADNDFIYLTIDIDALPAAEAPGVSAPAALGVPLRHIQPLVASLLASGKVIACDLAEFNPDHDIDNHTARVVARLVHQMAGQS